MTPPDELSREEARLHALFRSLRVMVFRVSEQFLGELAAHLQQVDAERARAPRLSELGTSALVEFTNLLAGLDPFRAKSPRRDRR